MNEPTVKEWYLAGSKADIPELKRLIQIGVPVDTDDPEKTTALMKAAWMDNVEMCDLLIQNGAEVNRPNRTYRNAIMMAAVRGSTNVIDILIKNGADALAHDEDGENAIILAFERNNIQTGRQILKNLENHGEALNYAARFGQEDIVYDLVESGVNINSKCGFGSKPINSAIEAEQPKLVQYFIDKGAEIDLNCFKSCVNFESEQSLKILLENGGDIHQKDTNGYSPLEIIQKYNPSLLRVYENYDLSKITSNKHKRMKNRLK